MEPIFDASNQAGMDSLSTHSARRLVRALSPEPTAAATGNAVVQHREALRAEVEQTMRAMRRTPARGTEGAAGRRNK